MTDDLNGKVATILAALDSDASARRGLFPVFENDNVSFIAARLSCYADGERWGLAIGRLGYFETSKGHDALQNMIYSIGNCLTRAGIPPWDYFPITADPNGVGNFTGEFLDDVNRDVQAIQIRSDVVNIPGEVLDRVFDRGKHRFRAGRAVSLFRELFSVYGSTMLPIPTELATRVPPDLPVVLTIDEWCHPHAGDRPSQSPTFQQLAEVLATGDASRFKQPGEVNTDWRSWIG